MENIVTGVVVRAHDSLTNPHNVQNVRAITEGLIREHPTLARAVAWIGVEWEGADAEGWTDDGSVKVTVHSVRPLSDAETAELHVIGACHWAVGEYEGARSAGRFPEPGAVATMPDGTIVDVVATYKELTNNPESSRSAVLAVLAANTKHAAA